ncbi:hypothetical protein HMN09_00643700 [Mycena chlorophos]|uniref:MFS general substrate transporter n=1 Tax=Mycena chlorophos TaxID=658473 RepID=A0A8H6T4Q8_MYCCL|nr:hypothetical protein HMN09_00643700 [Mycena chlorophos]
MSSEEKAEMAHLEVTTSASTTDPKATENSQSFGDAANALLGAHAHDPVIVSPEDNARLLRKTDLYLLPVMLGIYFLQQLDKSTLSYASVFNLVKDANLVGYQYSSLSSIVYAAQFIWQPVSSYFLVRLPVGRWLAFNVFAWGVVLSLMSTARSFSTLIAARFFLGIFEATVAPTFVTITAMWWRRREQTQRTSLWYAMNGVTTIAAQSILPFTIQVLMIDPVRITFDLWVGAHSQLAEAVPSMLAIIFLFTGLLTVAFSVIVLILLPNSPTTARFLSLDDKVLVLERLRANNTGTETKKWKWEQVRECLLDLKTWCWFLLIFTISIPSGGISTFGPLIVDSLGFNQFQTILLQMPFGAMQVIATLGGGFFAARFKRKWPVLVGLTIPPIAGAAALLKINRSASNAKAALLASYYLVSFYPGISPIIYTWSSQNTAGHTKKTLTTGVLFIGQSAGNVVGPFLYTTAQAPLYHEGLESSLVCFAVLAGLMCFTAFYLNILNRQQIVRRIANGKTGELVDASLEETKDAGAAQQANGAQFGANAFDDLTDRQNEDFIYVL